MNRAAEAIVRVNEPKDPPDVKILIVDRASAFSIWTLMDAVAGAARAAGHEVVYCRLDDGTPGAPPPPEGVRLHRIKTPPRSGFASRAGQWIRFCRGFPGIVRSERPDVVHTNFAVPGIAARLIARALGVPVVISTYHETRGSLNPLYRLAVAATNWTAARRIYVSEACARSFGATAPVYAGTEAPPEARDVVVLNGIAAPSIPEAEAEAVPDAGRLRLVFAGRLMPEKGLGALIEAVEMLAARGIDAQLDIYGDGPARDELERMSRPADSVRFHGWADHATTMAAFANAACVVVPSGGEGFGLALAEALAVAPRIVASDIPVFREVADGLGEGLAFAAPRNPAALADAIARVVAAPAAPDRLKARRAAAAARFDIGGMGRTYVRLYTGV